jgi:hypothetical protein
LTGGERRNAMFDELEESHPKVPLSDAERKAKIRSEADAFNEGQRRAKEREGLAEARRWDHGFEPPKR